MLELFRFWDATSRWYPVFMRDRREIRALDELERELYRGVEALVLAAWSDPPNSAALQVVFAMSGPGTHGSFLQAGISTERAAETVTQALTAWIDRYG
ncbi:MAG: hypothetical protein JRI25_19120 [Deltaproteobacteria bacterium]|nr:hypothetical protein [Deltaproteobacteria bacterium]